jgi:hypothetical protein
MVVPVRQVAVATPLQTAAAILTSDLDKCDAHIGERQERIVKLYAEQLESHVVMRFPHAVRPESRYT